MHKEQARAVSTGLDYFYLEYAAALGFGAPLPPSLNTDGRLQFREPKFFSNRINSHHKLGHLLGGRSTHKNRLFSGLWNEHLNGMFYRSATSLGRPGGRAIGGLPLNFSLPEARTLTSSNMAVKALPIAAGVVVAGVAAALLNQWLAKKAERRNPPSGRFITVHGVRLHYVERGTGTPLILLHGNGSMIEDFQSSGLVDLAAKKYRVIAFDRPGFGHSERPRSTIWTPAAQADLIAAAMKEIGVPQGIVLGHSWGTLVSLGLAIKYPHLVQSLILASGYYYPTARADVVMLSPPAIPLIGDLLSHTISPLLSRLIWPLLLRKIFGPSPVPGKFRGFPEEMAVRPSQIRASAAESALMIPSAHAFQNQYRLLKMPVAIVVGEEDRLIESEQSARLHRDIAHSTLQRVPGTGHMVHQTATAEIMTAIDMVAAQKQNTGPLMVPNAA